MTHMPHMFSKAVIVLWFLIFIVGSFFFLIQLRVVPSRSGGCMDHDIIGLKDFCVSCNKEVDFVPILQGNTLTCVFSVVFTEAADHTEVTVRFASADGAYSRQKELDFNDVMPGGAFQRTSTFAIPKAGSYDIRLDKVDYYTEGNYSWTEGGYVSGLYIPTEDEADVKLLSRNVFYLTYVLFILGVPSALFAAGELYTRLKKEEEKQNRDIVVVKKNSQNDGNNGRVFWYGILFGLVGGVVGDLWITLWYRAGDHGYPWGDVLPAIVAMILFFVLASVAYTRMVRANPQRRI